MPQLDVTTFPSQLFWLSICFLVLYLILARSFLPKVARILQTRQSALELKINQASLYQEQAETLLKEYEQELAYAHIEAQEKAAAALQAIAEDMALKKQNYSDKLTALLHLEEQKLYRIQVDARAKIGSMAEEVAKIILEKLIPHSPGKRRLKK